MLLAICITLMGIQLGITQNLDESCLMFYTNINGTCTLASKCPSARSEYQRNGIPPTICKHSGKKLLVCCKDGSSSLTTVWYHSFTTEAVERIDTPLSSRRVSERKCEEYSRGVVQNVNSAPKCDYTGVELIVGGENASRGEFPHMAAIGYLDFDDDYAFKCGGSLISPRFVLTAGYCMSNQAVKNPQPEIVRLGDQNLNREVQDGADPVDVSIKAIHIHPQYKTPEKYNDIALLELRVDVDFRADIRPACLWNKPGFPDYTKAISTGWGLIFNTGLIFSRDDTMDELQKVQLEILENDYCDGLLETMRNRHWRGFQDSQMCAAELRGGKNILCQGYSGSPLQIASKGNICVFHVIGTSFGRYCAESVKPTIYTRVYSYLDWIESIVWPGE